MFLLYVVLVLFNYSDGHTKLGDSCEADYALHGGVCKAYYDCPEARRLYEEETQELVICADDDEGPSIICCPQKRMIESRMLSTESASMLKCKDYRTEYERNIDAVPLSSHFILPQCAKNGQPLIKGGEQAKYGEFPHMAVIGYEGSDSKYEWQCSGTLISKNYVLTASHCSHQSNSPAKKVRLGYISVLREDVHLKPGLEFGITDFIKHNQYAGPPLYNDIALIRLDRDVRFSNNIRPACLWPSYNLSEFSKAIVTGFGNNDSSLLTDSFYNGRLQKIELSVLDRAELCPNRDSVHLPNGYDEAQMFCAKDKRPNVTVRRDACQGDSGGPIQVFDRNNPCITHVIGVTVYGNVCGFGGIYIRVAHYLKWIEDIVWPPSSTNDDLF